MRDELFCLLAGARPFASLSDSRGLHDLFKKPVLNGAALHFSEPPPERERGLGGVQSLGLRPSWGVETPLERSGVFHSAAWGTAPIPNARASFAVGVARVRPHRGAGVGPTGRPPAIPHSPNFHLAPPFVAARLTLEVNAGELM